MMKAYSGCTPIRFARRCVIRGALEGETMRLVLGTIALTLASSCPGIAQKWEIGGLGGYGWYQNSTVSTATISNPPASATIGFPSRATVGVVFAENLYD